MLKAREIPNLRHIKADPNIIEEFYRIADAQGWVLGETLAETQHPEYRTLYRLPGFSLRWSASAGDYAMSIAFERVSYQSLNSRQQEAYNFQKVSAVLADYGYVTIRLTNDWRGADFIAQHFDGINFLKAQLKGRASFDKKYRDRDLYICFPHSSGWYMYPHDAVLAQLLAAGVLEGTDSWDSHGAYSFPKLSKRLKVLLEPYRLGV